jgi:hypothetical protein
MSEAKMAFHIAWSKWRRQHQAIARWYRMQHRMKAEQKTLANPALDNRSRYVIEAAGTLQRKLARVTR